MASGYKGLEAKTHYEEMLEAAGNSLSVGFRKIDTVATADDSGLPFGVGSQELAMTRNVKGQRSLSVRLLLDGSHSRSPCAKTWKKLAVMSHKFGFAAASSPSHPYRISLPCSFNIGVRLSSAT